jgi:hypothetical protein
MAEFDANWRQKRPHHSPGWDTFKRTRKAFKLAKRFAKQARREAKAAAKGFEGTGSWQGATEPGRTKHQNVHKIAVAGGDGIVREEACREGKLLVIYTVVPSNPRIPGTALISHLVLLDDTGLRFDQALGSLRLVLAFKYENQLRPAS